MNSLKKKIAVLLCILHLLHVPSAFAFGIGSQGFDPDLDDFARGITGVAIIGVGLVVSIAPFFFSRDATMSPDMKAFPRINAGTEIKVLTSDDQQVFAHFLKYRLLDADIYKEQCESHFRASNLDSLPLEFGSMIKIVGRYSAGHELSGEFLGFSKDQILVRGPSGAIIRLSNLETHMVQADRQDPIDIRPWSQSTPPAREQISLIKDEVVFTMPINEIDRIQIQRSKGLHAVGAAIMLSGFVYGFH
jgi:hypothetical protein